MVLTVGTSQEADRWRNCISKEFSDEAFKFLFIQVDLSLLTGPELMTDHNTYKGELSVAKALISIVPRHIRKAG